MKVKETRERRRAMKRVRRMQGNRRRTKMAAVMRRGSPQQPSVGSRAAEAGHHTGFAPVAPTQVRQPPLHGRHGPPPPLLVQKTQLGPLVVQGEQHPALAAGNLPQAAASAHLCASLQMQLRSPMHRYCPQEQI
jgi:hypothetical protein